MKIQSSIAIVLLTLLLFGCEKEIISIDESDAEIEASDYLKSRSGITSYILISRTNKLPTNLEKELKAINGSLLKVLSEVGIASVESDDPSFAIKASKIRGIQSVIPNFSGQMIDPEERNWSVAASFNNPPVSGDDDFFFDLQWGHDAIDAPEAWNAGYRGAGVRVGVLDTGFDLNHPDLIPNINSTLSKDFTGEGLQYTLDDPFSHGTHTAGTIGAADNGFGTIGVAPEVDLVLLKVLNDEGSGSFFDILDAIEYAALNEVDVINMSFAIALNKRGGEIEGETYTAREVAALVVALNRVTYFAFQKGTTIIAAAGNDGTDYDHSKDLIHIPSQLAHVISISATGPNGWALDKDTNPDLPAFYTNYGQKTIDFAAPGGNVDFELYESEILATATVAGLERPAYVFDFVFSTGNQGWFWSIGTSMASPHAVGVAALIIGKNGGSMNPSQVEAVLRASADDLGKPGKDDFYGNGRINAFRAVSN